MWDFIITNTYYRKVNYANSLYLPTSCQLLIKYNISLNKFQFWSITYIFFVVLWLQICHFHIDQKEVIEYWFALFSSEKKIRSGCPSIPKLVQDLITRPKAYIFARRLGITSMYSWAEIGRTGQRNCRMRALIQITSQFDPSSSRWPQVEIWFGLVALLKIDLQFWLGFAKFM